MTLEDIRRALDGAWIHQGSDGPGLPVQAVVAGDLMSDILTSEDEAPLLVTSLATDQVVRTADFVGARALVLVNGKKPTESLLALARQGDISVVGTSLRMFEACVVIGALRRG